MLVENEEYNIHIVGNDDDDEEDSTNITYQPSHKHQRRMKMPSAAEAS